VKLSIAQGSQTQIAPRAKLGPIGNPEGSSIMALTQHWRYRNLARNSFYILFPAKGIVSYRQIISSRLCFVWKELVHSLP